MPGRTGKPTHLIKIEGNKGRHSKKDLEFREEFEKSLYTGTSFKEDPTTKNDPVAHKEFLRLKRLFKQIKFYDGLDQAAINRYCQLKSQEDSLQKICARLTREISEMEKLEDINDHMKIVKSFITKQNQIQGMILKLEDRLFLNPTSRIRSVPPKEKEKPDKSRMSSFLEKKRSK